MKKVISINFQGRLIKIEETAYENLKLYIQSLHTYFANEEGKEEIISDIEWRISELFDNILRKGNVCVTEEDLENIINTMGRPEDLQKAEEDNSQQQKESNATQEHNTPLGKKQFFRDSVNNKIGGVCSGIAQYFNIDVSLVRIITILSYFTFGIGILIYLVIWIVTPIQAYPVHTHRSKRLFRDPFNKKIGGVCSGLAHYLGLDPILIRILFVILLISASFPFGLTLHISIFFLYIILWISIPKAKNATEVLSMKGENVDLQNIKQSVQAELQDDKRKLLRQYQHTPTKKNHIINKILKVLIIFFSIVVILNIIIAIISFLFIADNLLFEQRKDMLIATVGFTCTFLLPFIALIVWAIRRIKGIKHQNNRRVASFISLWIIGIIATGFSIFTVIKMGKYTSQIPVEKISIQNPNSNTLTLHIGDKQASDINLQRLIPLYTTVKMSPSPDSNYHLFVQKISRGNSVANANGHANKIQIPITQIDNTVYLKKDVFMTNNHKWRNQHIHLTIQVPVGKDLVIQKQESAARNFNIKVWDIFVDKDEVDIDNWYYHAEAHTPSRSIFIEP